jgi:hypothetical protein
VLENGCNQIEKKESRAGCSRRRSGAGTWEKSEEEMPAEGPVVGSFTRGEGWQEAALPARGFQKQEDESILQALH